MYNSLQQREVFHLEFLRWFGRKIDSRYYALTNLKVSGTLEINENEFDVKGIGWMDRQWGNWDYSGIGGWNWFSLFHVRIFLFRKTSKMPFA